MHINEYTSTRKWIIPLDPINKYSSNWNGTIACFFFVKCGTENE